MLTLYYFLTSILLAGLAIYSRAVRPTDYKWTKPQPVAWILAWALIWIWPHLSGEQIALPITVLWILAGLFLGLLGDIFLLNKRWFILGFVGFVLGHFAYIIGFAQIEFGLPPVMLALLSVPGIAYASLVSKKTHSRKMLPFVWIYMLVITSMLITSVNILHHFATGPVQASHISTGAMATMLGASLFCISDAFWSWNKFVKPLRYPGQCILSTYYGGQTLIAFGIMRLYQLA